MLQKAKQRFWYVLIDYLSINVAWCIFNVVRYFTVPENDAESFFRYLRFPMVILGQVTLPLLMLALFAISGYYNRVFFKSRLSDIINAYSITLIGSIVIFFLVLFNDSIPDRLGNIETILVLWLIMGTICCIPRLMLTSHTTSEIRRHKIGFNTAIVGNNAAAQRLADTLQQKYNNMGHRIVAIGDVEDVLALNDSLDIDSFIIATDPKAISQTIDTINKLLPTGKSVLITPDVMQALAIRPRTEMVAGQVLVDISHADVSDSTANLKRIGDLIFASAALVLLSPIMAAIALLIKRDSAGPVIYKQERIGYKKKPFNILKFRTMRNDAEDNGPALSSVDDERVTRIGRFLRKYRLDELPQFWNVLRGEMSIVGPRPERQYYLTQIIERAPYFNIVHQVRPGITSWGMVRYGYASSVEQMVQRMQYDLIYIENISFAVDMKILFYTIRTVLTGKGV